MIWLEKWCGGLSQCISNLVLPPTLLHLILAERERSDSHSAFLKSNAFCSLSLSATLSQISTIPPRKLTFYAIAFLWFCPQSAGHWPFNISIIVLSCRSPVAAFVWSHIPTVSLALHGTVLTSDLAPATLPASPKPGHYIFPKRSLLQTFPHLLKCCFPSSSSW